MKKVCLCVIALAAFAAGAAEVKAVKNGSRIDVTVGDAFFTSYRFNAEEKYPFFFPVNGPSGASVTSMRNGVYPHHSSLFFGCDRVNGGDYWQEGLERGQIVSEGAKLAKASGTEVVIEDACIWKRPGAEPPFKDTRRITISAPKDGLRQIDFDVTLEALTDVEIKITNHSLFSVRLDPDITVKYGGAMKNAEGKSGQKETHGVASPWMAAFGKRGDGKVEGIAVLQHPSNPGFPVKWETRDYGFLSPTPYQFPQDGKSVTYKKGEKVALRYRVLVFSGTAEEAAISQTFEAYKNGK
jgi:hypothetical protein